MATIGKTFSDPEKWESAWFSRLDTDQKLLFTYMWERCDHAGVLEFIPNVWSAHTGLQIDSDCVHTLMNSINTDKERLVNVGDKFWFPEYIRYNQQSDPDKSLSAKHPFHKHVWKRVKHHCLFDAINTRDPILLKEFVSSSDCKTKTSKANVRLSEGLGKPTGRGRDTGSGSGGGTSEEEGAGTDSNNPIQISDEELEAFKTFSP